MTIIEKFESVSNFKLVNKCPVIIRIDGKNFRNWTRQLDRPFDIRLVEILEKTTVKLMKEIQNVQFGYFQSDEISLLLDDSIKEETQSWFDNRIQKLSSISASLTTAFFNAQLPSGISPAIFDARAFNIPTQFIKLYFEERRSNAIANSIQAFGRTMFTSNQLTGKNIGEVQQMLILAGKPWSSLDPVFRFGELITKDGLIKVAEDYDIFDKLVI